MASNDIGPTSSSDSEVSEMEDYDLEVKGSPATRMERKRHMPTIR